MSSIIRATTTSGLQVAPDNSGSLQLQTNGTTAAVTIDTSQNVGIGTTSPASRLELSSSATSAAAGFTSTNTNSAGYSTLQLRNTGTSGRTYTIAVGGNTSGNPGAFYVYDDTAPAERMRIDSGGRVLINATTTLVNESHLSVTGSGNTVAFKTTGGSGTQPLLVWNAGNSGTRELIGFGTTSASFSSVGGIATNGSSTAYNTSSDYRLKENIVPMTGALTIVQALKPVTYKWKQDGSDGQGFIAHELAEIVPDAVTGEKDAVDAEGKPVYQGIDTSFLVATLTAAIQEQQTIINDLKARIETLEAK